MNIILISTGVRWLWLTLVLLAIDLGSKKWIMTHFLLGESVQIIPFINFSYKHNPGAAFSFLANQGGWQRWVFILIAIIIILVLLLMMYYTHYQNRLINAAYAIIIGGAFGNLFDRIVHGVVIDFIDFYVNTWHWATFNVADIGICIGTTLIFLEGFFQSTNENLANKKHEKNDKKISRGKN